MRAVTLVLLCPSQRTARRSNSNNSSIDLESLQPGMEICNRKEKVTSTRVVKNNITRVV